MADSESIQKHIKFITDVYKSATTTTSNLCRTIVFALIAAVWALFQQHGVFKFEGIPKMAIGLLSIYVCIDVFQYFASASIYFALYQFRNRLGEKIIVWHQMTDKILYFFFLLKVLYLFVIMVIGVCTIFGMNGEDLFNQYSNVKK